MLQVFHQQPQQQQPRHRLPGLRSPTMDVTWDSAGRNTRAQEDDKPPHIGQLENIRGSQFLLDLSQQIEPEDPWLACTHARRCRHGAASGWTAMLFLFVESLVLSQDKTALYQAISQLNMYARVVSGAVMHLGFDDSIRVQCTLTQLLADLANNLDSVTIMCQLEDAVNDDLRHDAMVAYIKILAAAWQSSHGMDMAPFPMNDGANENIIGTPTEGPDEASIVAFHDLLMRPLGFELDFVHPKPDGGVDVKMICRFCSSKLSVPVMALVCATDYYCLLSVRPDLSIEDHFSWPSLLPQHLRPGHTAVMATLPGDAYPAQWPVDQGMNGWSGSPMMHGMSMDSTGRVRTGYTPEQGMVMHASQAPVVSHHGQMRAPVMSASHSLDMAGLMSQVPGIAPAGVVGSTDRATIQPRAPVHLQARTRLAPANMPVVKSDPIRFSVHNTWIPGEPAHKQTLIPLQRGAPSQQTDAASRRPGNMQPPRYNTIHFKAVDPSERQSRSKARRAQQKRRDDPGAE